MSTRKNLFQRFVKSGHNFKPYYESENGFRRITIIHSIGAFIIAPIYSFFISYANVPEVYFYIGISYTVLFPIYVLICWLIRSLNDKLMYFFILHLFGMTLAAFISTLSNEFVISELFTFFGLFAVTVVIIQRWYALVLYNAFVFLLMLYGLQTIGTINFSYNLIAVLFFVLGASSMVVLYSKKQMIHTIEDYSEYLQKLLNNPGASYILFDLLNENRVVDFNIEAKRLFGFKHANDKGVSKLFFELFTTDELEEIKRLALGGRFTKRVEYVKGNRIKHIEFSIVLLALKNNDFWLARVDDVSEEVHKHAELELSEKKYRNLYYKNKAGVFTLDKNSKILDGNKSFFDMFEGTLTTGDILFGVRDKEKLSGRDDLFGQKEKKDWNVILESLGESENYQNYQTQYVLSNKNEKTFIFSWYLDAQTNHIEGSVINLTSIQKTAKALRQSEEKYRLIYEESNDAILLLKGDEIIESNRKTTQLFGVPLIDLKGKNLYDLSANKSEIVAEKFNAHFDKLSNSRSTKFEWLFAGNQRTIEAEVTLIEIMLENELYYQCVIQDNTVLNKNIRTIQKSQRNLESILENNPEGIMIVKEDNILYMNSEMKNLVGNNFNFDNIFIESDQIKFNDSIKVHVKDRSNQNIQLNLLNEHKEQVLVDVTLVGTIYEEEEASLIIMKDISVQNTLAKEKLRAELAEESNKSLAKEIMERIRTEKLLEEQFLRTKAILDSSSNTFLLTITLDEDISSYNSHCKTYFSTIFGKELRTKVSFEDYFKEIISPARLRLFRILFSQVKQGKSRQFELKMNFKDAEYWLDIFMNPIFDTEGDVAEISLVAHDISEKKKSNIEIVESLKEKEILLKEIHHRVKNNLQVISSILNLQSSFVTDENTLDILQESRNRIRSMAIIHENLYRTEDFSSINFSNYLENLTTNLVSSYRIHEEVVLDLNLEEVDLVLDQAIPSGLLVNEIITNALKYAWGPGVKGTISINLKDVDGIVYLEISDDGVGLPSEFTEMESDTLGLQLVITLVEQLDGEIEVDIKKGTKYLIKFDNIKPTNNV